MSIAPRTGSWAAGRRWWSSSRGARRAARGPDTTFKVPAYPRRKSSIRGGWGCVCRRFMAYVGGPATSRSPTCVEPGLRMAMARSRGGVRRAASRDITLQEVRGRVKAFRDLVHFSLDVRSEQIRAAGVKLDTAEKRSGGSPTGAIHARRRSRAARSRVGGMVPRAGWL